MLGDDKVCKGSPNMNSSSVTIITVHGLLKSLLRSKWYWPIKSKLITITLHVTHRGSNYRVQGAMIFATNQRPQDSTLSDFFEPIVLKYRITLKDADRTIYCKAA
jgi:hypothetical protein